MSLHVAGDTGKRFNMDVLPDAEIARRDAAAIFHGSGFDDDESRSPDGTAAQVNQMPIVGKAVLGGVLAHGRDSDAIR